ncbi:MAG: hypothetical protein RJA70_4094 [Pseudomonadota bacterium]
MIAQKLAELLPTEYSKAQQFQPASLATGQTELDAHLPDVGFPRGQVIELSMTPGAGLGTSLALWACRAAQREAELQGSTAWCAFIDPFATLYAPAVFEAGVDLRRLLVVRPSLEALSRVAVRLAEAQAFSVVVIDTMGCLEGEAAVASNAGKNDGTKGIGSQHWIRAVRRLALAIHATHSQVFLLTDKDKPRMLPLPVGLRLELTRKKTDVLEVKVTKDKRGRINDGRLVQLARPAQLRKTSTLKFIEQSTEERSRATEVKCSRLSVVPVYQPNEPPLIKAASNEAALMEMSSAMATPSTEERLIRALRQRPQQNDTQPKQQQISLF